jgi:hypothetical protein
MLKSSKATEPEMTALDRLFHGHPEDFNRLPPARRQELEPLLEVIRQEAQRITAAMKALGLPIRDAWLDAESHWYPNQWKHRTNVHVAGQVFNTIGRKMGLTRADLAHTKRRTSDMWAVYQGKKIATMPGRRGARNEAIFDNKEDALAFMAKHEGPYKARYTARNEETGKRERVEESFKTRAERTHFLNVEAPLIEGVDPDRILTVETLNEPRLRLSPPMTLEQKIAHGLIEDVVSNIQGFRHAQALVAKSDFFNSIAQHLVKEDIDGEFFSETSKQPSGGYSFVPVKGLGLGLDTLAKKNATVREFNNGFVRSDIAADMKEYFGGGGKMMKLVKNIERQMRAQVTYRWPWRHPKQFVENEFMLFIADTGVSMDVAGRAKDAARYWQHFATGKDVGTDMKEFLEDHHFGNTDFVTSEISNRFVDAMATQSDMNSQTVFDGIIGTAGKVEEALKTAYAHEDLIYKFQLYAGLRRRGFSSEQAAKATRDYMFDWSNAPKFVRAMRFIPFAPSVGWQFTRIFGNKLRNEFGTSSLKMAMMIGAAAAMREGLDELAGLDDDDRKREDFGRFEFVMPLVKDSKGRLITADMTYMVPYRAIFGFEREAMTPKDLRRFGRSFLPMMAQAPLTAMFQQDRWGNPLLWEGTKDPEKIKAQWNRYFMQVASDAMPGFPLQYMTSAIRNAQREPKRQQDWWAQMVTGPMGIRGKIDWQRPGPPTGRRRPARPQRRKRPQRTRRERP